MNSYVLKVVKSKKKFSFLKKILWGRFRNNIHEKEEKRNGIQTRVSSSMQRVGDRFKRNAYRGHGQGSKKKD